MSSTLLKNIRVYKCNEPEHWNDTIYAVLVNTAESNIFPQTCHYWTIAVGQKYEVLILIHRAPTARCNPNSGHAFRRGAAIPQRSRVRMMFSRATF